MCSTLLPPLFFSLDFRSQKKLRGPSLIDQHAKAIDAKKDDSEGPPVIWDHSRDMAIGGRLMDDDKRNAMVRESKGLGDRFSSGRSGGFL